MQKWMILFVIVMLAVSVTVAADNESSRIKTSQGDKALIFTVGGLGSFDLDGQLAGLVMYPDQEGFSSDELKGIGVKTFLSDNMALRLGFGYETMTRTDEADEGDHTLTYSVMAIMPALEYHLYQSGPVSIYTGAGLFYASMSSSTEAPNSDEQKMSASTMGFAGLLGAEFYPWKSVSFAAEYWLGYMSGSSKMEYGDDEADGPKLSAMGTNSFGVMIGFHW